jgi:hypothetical protein
MSQEMVYTTSGASADVAGGGVRLNMIPRDGGNTMSGSVFYGYQNDSFQSNNVGDDLKKRGLTTSDGIGKLSNLEGSLGGPIKKDKVWYFGSARLFYLDTLPANTFYGQAGTGTATSAPMRPRKGGRPPEHQVDPGAHHLADEPEEQAGDLQRPPAEEPRFGHDGRLRPDTAGIVWNSPIYTTGSVKFSSTASSKIYIETGFSTNYERYNTILPGGPGADAVHA